MYADYESLCIERGLKPYKVAAECGIPSATIASWKNGKYVPKIDKLQKLADYLGVPVEKFSNIKASTIQVPILGRVAAGVPMDMIEEVLGYEEIAKRDGEFFGLKIDGNSMEPYLLRGDTVIVKKQSDVESGDIAIVALNGSDAVCKRIMKDENGITLVSLNPAYAPRRFDNEEIENLPVTILGKVIEQRRTY